MYSLPYILLIIFYLSISSVQLGFRLDEKSNWTLNFLVLIVYILFWGFRGYIATDWVNYYPFFKNLPTNLLLAINHSDFESGFVLYSAIIKNFFTSFETYQLINTLTNVCLLHIFFKKYLPSKYYALGFAVFLVFYGCIFEINLLRNFKGLLLFLIALPYIEQRKPIKYFTLITLAILFHWSSIVFVPLYFFLHKEIPLKVFLITFIVGSFIYLLQIEYITPIIKLFSSLLPKELSVRILNYTNIAAFSKSYGLTFVYFERTLTTFFVLLYYNKIKANRANILLINSFFIYITLFLFCSEMTIILTRVAGNFAYSYWILIPIIIQQSERNFKPLIITFFALFFILKMHLMMNNIFFDYDSFLFGNSKSYEQRFSTFEKHRKEIDK